MYLRLLLFLSGFTIVAGTLFSAIETFVLPRGIPDWLTRSVFHLTRVVFTIPLRLAKSEEYRDRVMAFYAPITLFLMVPIWYGLIGLGYATMYFTTGTQTWSTALQLSGSSLLTLGFNKPGSTLQTFLVFSEATLGLLLVALLIAYLPTMYSAFSRRESAVTMLEVRAGSPPSAVEMLRRFQRIHGLQHLTEHWQQWESWFADIEESHTSLAPLVYFRSPRFGRSWVTASGAVLDAAALSLSTVDIPNDPQAALCLRAGFLALRSIADFFGIDYNSDPHFPNDPISITRQEYDQACQQLADQGVPLKNDLDQAWLDFAGWRVNYDRVLIALASLTMAPSAQWSSDRADHKNLPAIFYRRRSHPH